MTRYVIECIFDGQKRFVGGSWQSREAAEQFAEELQADSEIDEAMEEQLGDKFAYSVRALLPGEVVE